MQLSRAIALTTTAVSIVAVGIGSLGIVALGPAAPAEAANPISRPGVTSTYIEADASGGAFTPDGSKLWLWESPTGRIGVFSPATMTRTATIQTTFNSRTAPFFSSDGKRAYAFNTQDPALSVFDVDHPAVSKVLGTGGSAYLVAASADGDFIYNFGANSWSNSLTVVDTRTSAVTVRPMPAVNWGSIHGAYSPERDKVYIPVADGEPDAPAGTGTLRTIDTTTGAETDLALPAAPLHFAVSDDGSTGWIASAAGLTAIDLVDSSVGATVALPSTPSSLAAAAAGTRAVVALQDGTIDVVDLVAGRPTLLGSIATKEPGVAITLSRDGTRAFVRSYAQGDQHSTLFEVDLASATLVSAVDAGWHSIDPIESPDGSRLFIGADYSVLSVSMPRKHGQASVSRFDGYDRYDTADLIASTITGSDVIYITSGASFPDALSAAALAATNHAPLILTDPNAMSPSIWPRIYLGPYTRAVIVGGPEAVSEHVADQLREFISVERLAGDDRYATSRKAVDRTFPAASAPDTVFVVTGRDFPDALGSVAAASSRNDPVVLVDGSKPTLDAATRAQLVALQGAHYAIVGGPRSVSAGIERELAGLAPTERYAGADRYQTSITLNEAMFPQPSIGYLASGAGFADALAGSDLAGVQKAPLFIVPPTCVPAPVATTLSAPTVARIQLFGGANALAPAVESLSRC